MLRPRNLVAISLHNIGRGHVTEITSERVWLSKLMAAPGQEVNAKEGKKNLSK